MPLLPWRTSSPDGNGQNHVGSQDVQAAPEVPVDSRTGSPLTYIAGGNPGRLHYSRRDPVSNATPVTRTMATAMHERVNRIGQARDWLGRWQDRMRGQAPRPIRKLDEHTGEPLAQWILKNVLHARKRPVPSFGFGLAPVLTHSVAAWRQRKLRGTALAAALVFLGMFHLRGLTAIAITMVLTQLFWGRRGQAILRWAFRSVLSTVLLAVAALGMWTLARPYMPMLVEATKDGARVSLHLLIAATAVYSLDRWACHAYLQSLRSGRERIAERPWLAPFSSKKIDECAVTEEWQSIAYRKENGADRFVGAGLDSWQRGATRIQLASARTTADDEPSIGTDETDLDSYQKFEADELLDKVRDELEDLSGNLVETHALPNCDVAEFLGVPESRWQKLTREAEGHTKAEWPEAIEMCTEAREAPTGHFSRRYLAAQVVSWEGQIVVTVFAHAALEGNTLHFVTRPHALAPLLPSVNGVPAKGFKLVRKLTETPLHACGDTVELVMRLYNFIGRGLGLISVVNAAPAIVPQKDDGSPVSLREHCGRVTSEDMHQTEDIQRYVSILQTRMFSTVSSFLANHGLAVGEFQRQAIAITQNFISGDNNQVNTGNLGGGMHQQGNAPSPTGKAERTG